MAANRSLSVLVVASPHGEPIGRAIAGGLTEMGVAVLDSQTAGAEQGDPPGHAVVVVTADAHADPKWHATIDRLTGTRLVPVRVGDIDANTVPESVRELNWIDWQPEQRTETFAKVYSALHSEIALYRLYRVLAAEAASWQAANRSKDLLIADGKRVGDAVRFVADAATDPLAQPTEVLRDYVTASARASRSYRRRRIGRWTTRSLAALSALALFATAVLELRAANRSAWAGSLAATTWVAPTRPDWTGLLAATAVIEGTPTMQQLGRTVLWRDLSIPWAEGIVGGGNYPNPVSAVQFVGTGGTALALDSLDRLSLWDVRRQRPLWIRPLGSGRASAFAATPDGTLAVLAVGHQLDFAFVSPWRRWTVTVPCDVGSLAAAPADGVIVAVCPNALYSVSLATARVTGPIGRFDHAIEVKTTTDGHARALVREDPHRIAVIDPVTGRTTASTTLDSSEFESGALGPDGLSAAIVGTDRQIRYATRDLRFEPTGVAVPDTVQVLEILPGRRIVYGGSQFGIQLLGLDSGLKLGQVCATLANIGSVSSTRDGDLLACMDGGLAAIWSLAAFSPVQAPSTAPITGPDAVSAVCGLRVTGSPDGRVAFSGRGAGQSPIRAELRPDQATVAATAIGADCESVLVGYADGLVVEVDLTGQAAGVVGRWSFPDHSPITSVGWSASPAHLEVGTSAGYWWAPLSCDGCGHDAVLAAHVRHRLWGCYLPPALVYVGPAARTELGISVCGQVPQPLGG